MDGIVLGYFPTVQAIAGPWRALEASIPHLSHRLQTEFPTAYKVLALAWLYVQTYADLLTWKPHVHTLVADGEFTPSGAFRVLPRLPEETLREALRAAVGVRGNSLRFSARIGT